MKDFRLFFKEPLKSFSIFDFKATAWPDYDDDDNQIFHEFGNAEMKNIVDHFKPVLASEEEAVEIQQQWSLLRGFIYANKVTGHTTPFKLYVQMMRDHFQLGYHQEMAAVLKIVEIMLVFSVSTASVERGFSTFNLIVTILRGRLDQGSKEKLMHISSTSPAVADFDPAKVISYWKELSTNMESQELFGYHIPSIYAVSKNEMLNREKKIKADLIIQN